MFRLLVVEDQVDFYNDYLLRIFEKLLPMEKIFVAHSPTLNSALEALQEPWNMILMDYNMGAAVTLLDSPIRDGADLVRFRRGIEAQMPRRLAFILSTSSNRVGNQLMAEQGADAQVLKIQVPMMAQIIAEELKKHG